MNQEPLKEQLLRCVVERVTFRNPDNGYSVLQVAASGHPGVITVVGTSLEVSAGTNLLIRGSFEEHRKFGRQFHAQAITQIAPSGKEEIIRFLGSGLVKGIAERTARRLVEHFGEKTLDVIEHTPDKLSEIPGFGRKKGLLLHKTLTQRSGMSEILRFLVEHNISTNLAERIQKKFGAESVEILKKDPYLLARRMHGVGFVTADSIAMKLGLAPDSPQRLKAGVYYALERSADDGHCFLPAAELSSKARQLLAIEDAVDLEPIVRELVQEQHLVRSEGLFYLRRLFKAEDFVAHFAAERSSRHDSLLISEKTAAEAIAEAERELGIQLTSEQHAAVKEVLQRRLLIITGGPGCGKTTIIRAISKLFSKGGKRLMLAAPTGRAAQRMAEVCDMPAATIHRLLKFDPYTRTFAHGINDPLPTDGVIVDESSMLDIELAQRLFSAIPHSATLILVGDKDQLPSVGPGKVFGDLCAASSVYSTHLTRLFRRSSESIINDIAHSINTGIVPQIPEPDGITKSDAYFLPKSNAEECAALIELLAADQIPKKFGIDAGQISVLTPSNKGPLGTIALNNRLQASLNPTGSSQKERIVVQDIEFRLHDRVCQRVNNYQLDENGVFNGDTGIIVSVDQSDLSMMVKLWDGRLIRYSGSALAQLSLAYAVTVHRAQGSELPCVVLALHDSQYTLLQRQLLYTAVTRAKQLLIIVGSRRALALASKRATSKQRFCRLTERIAAIEMSPLTQN